MCTQGQVSAAPAKSHSSRLRAGLFQKTNWAASFACGLTACERAVQASNESSNPRTQRHFFGPARKGGVLPLGGKPGTAPLEHARRYWVRRSAGTHRAAQE